MEPYASSQRMTWRLAEISESTGLSLAFLRAEVRAGRLPVRRFGRRVLVRNEDLHTYLDRGSEKSNAGTSLGGGEGCDGQLGEEWAK